MNLLKRLLKKHHLYDTVPEFVHSNIVYAVLTGSRAYATHDETSDYDIYAVCMPSLEHIVPWASGIIPGFNMPDKFPFQQKVFPKMADDNGKEYEITVVSLAKYIRLCLDGNPNMIDTLFVRDNCVMGLSPQMARIVNHKQKFLSKLCWHTFKGYAYGQIKLANNKNPEGKRVELYNKYGFDPKAAMHLVRLIDEVEQLMRSGTMDLHHNKDFHMSIKKGLVAFSDIRAYFDAKEKVLEALLASPECKLPEEPDSELITELFMQTIEGRYGLKRGVAPDLMAKESELFMELKRLVNKFDKETEQ